MSRPAGSHPTSCALAGHARLMRICRAAAVTVNLMLSTTRNGLYIALTTKLQ